MAPVAVRIPGPRQRLAAGEPGRGLRSLAPPDPDRLTRLLEPVVHALNMDLEGIRVTAAGRRRYSG